MVNQDIKEGHDITIHRLRRLKVGCSSGSGIRLALWQTQTLLEYRLVLAQWRPEFPCTRVRKPGSRTSDSFAGRDRWGRKFYAESHPQTVP